MSATNMKSLSRRRAFTLTELAIVLGIVGIILGAIWVAAGQVNEKARVTEATSQINAVAQNMTALLQGGYGVSAAAPACGAGAPPCNITASMITSKAIPQYLGTGTTASTPWNSTGFILSWIANNPRTYRMSFYNITRDACLGLIMQMTNCTPGQAGCPIAVYSKGIQPAVGNYAAPAYGPISTTTGAVTSATAETICVQNIYPGGGAVANSLEFDFTQ